MADDDLTLQTITHTLPISRAVLDDAEDIAGVVRRARRRIARMAALGRLAYGPPPLPGVLDTPAIQAAIARGIRGDNDEWHALVDVEVGRVMAEHRTAQRRALHVLERYDRLVKDEQARMAERHRLERAEQRRKAEVVTLTVERLCDRFYVSEAFAQHLVQPYCTCAQEDGSWFLCGHADDEGVRP